MWVFNNKLESGHQVYVVNGLKIFYPTEDSKCVLGVAFQIGWTY